MIRYFKELLSLLRSIDRRLEALERCVKKNPNHWGDRYWISTGHWND